MTESFTKPRLILTVGLSRSGKSTYLRNLGIPTVCPDEVRRYLGCFPFKADMESEVWKIVRVMVNCLFASGAQRVALDATNTRMARRNEWRSPDMWLRDFYYFDTSREECQRRAVEGGNDYLVPVIDRMADHFEPVTSMELLEGESWTDVRTGMNVISTCEKFWRNQIGVPYS